MILTPENVVSKAREFIGTPWHHAGRLKGIGIDCIGLLVCVSQELGVEISDDLHYGLLDEFTRMTRNIEAYCNLLQTDAELQSGDILVFRARNMLNHCGFYVAGGTMIHAYNSAGIGVPRVVEDPYDKNWQTRLVAVYRYKEFN